MWPTCVSRGGGVSDVPVPYEYLGKARAFRASVASCDYDAAMAINAAVAPLRRRWKNHPVPRQTDLIDAARDWRAIPGPRLGLKIDLGRKSLRIAELRLTASTTRLCEWDAGINED